MNKLNPIIRSLLLAGLAVYFLFFIVNCLITIGHPYPIDYAEGISLDRVIKITHWRWDGIYGDITHYPYLSCQYNPVAWVLIAALAKVFGGSLALGRSFSFGTALLLGLLIYLFVQRKTKDNYLAGLAALFYFASPYVYYQAHVFGDIMSLGIIFSLLGLYCVDKYEGSQKVFWAVPFFVLAFFTKQYFIAAPIAACLYLFFRDRKTAFIIGLAYSLCLAAGIAVAAYLTNGYFIFHTIMSNRFSYVVFKMVFEYISTIQIHFLLLTIAVVYVLSKLFVKKADLFSIYFMITALIALGVGKVGASSISYMLELLVVSCLLFALYFKEQGDQIAANIQSGLFISILLIGQLITLAHAPYAADSSYRLSSTPTYRDRLVGEQVSRLIKQATGPVISQDAGFVVINGQELLVDPILVTQLSLAGMWDQSNFVKDIDQRKFTLVLLKFDLATTKHTGWFTDEMLLVLRNNYQLVEQIGGNYLYKPLKKGPNR
jgi:hypothetical protein